MVFAAPMEPNKLVYEVYVNVVLLQSNEAESEKVVVSKVGLERNYPCLFEDNETFLLGNLIDAKFSLDNLESYFEKNINTTQQLKHKYLKEDGFEGIMYFDQSCPMYDLKKATETTNLYIYQYHKIFLLVEGIIA